MFPFGSSQVKYRSRVIVTLHVALARNFVDSAGLARDVMMFPSGSSWVTFREMYSKLQIPKTAQKGRTHATASVQIGRTRTDPSKTTFQTLSKHLPREGEKLTRTLTRGLLDRNKRERERPHRNRRVGERPQRKRNVLRARERPDKSEGQVRHRQVGRLWRTPAQKPQGSPSTRARQQKRQTCQPPAGWSTL